MAARPRRWSETARFSFYGTAFFSTLLSWILRMEPMGEGGWENKGRRQSHPLKREGIGMAVDHSLEAAEEDSA
ncbi:hypothetical protein SDJN03_04538, partial [Cucurbita argyrosperma subsp. sororia]